MRSLLPTRREDAAPPAPSARRGKPDKVRKPWCQRCGALTPELRRRTFAPDRDGSRCVPILVCPACDDWYVEREWLRGHWRI